MGTTPREPGLYRIAEGTAPVAKIATGLAEGAAQTVGLVPQFADFTQDPNVSRPPDYYLYVFNIGQKRAEIRRPPHFPVIYLDPCPKGQPYKLVAKVPSIVNIKDEIAETGRIVNTGIRGERFATDMLNPCNTSTDIWAEVSDAQMGWIDGGTNDLTRRGFFWTRNAEPTAEELAKARERMERHYKVVLVQAQELARDPKTRVQIGPEHHMAADYFKIRAEWHIVAELPALCPNCGDTIRDGAAFHFMPNGAVCVLDWRRAVDAGVKKREDVPRDRRWWDEDDGPLMPSRGH